MTPEERYADIREQSEVFSNKLVLKNLLIKHIREAVEEAVSSLPGNILFARNEALEEAAVIADTHNGCVDVECLSKSNCGATIARQILALKSHP